MATKQQLQSLSRLSLISPREPQRLRLHREINMNLEQILAAAESNKNELVTVKSPLPGDEVSEISMLIIDSHTAKALDDLAEATSSSRSDVLIRLIGEANEKLHR